MSSVVTKTGDKGETSLGDGSRVKKGHAQIHAYGTLDELNSWIGVIRSHGKNTALDEALKRIQNECFVWGAHLCMPLKPKAQIKLPPFSLVSIEQLEKEIHQWESKLPPLKNFILPSGTLLGSQLHFARTLARRAERIVAELLEENANEAWKTSLQYLNRLSDWFFIAARWVNLEAKQPEDPWSLK